MSATCRPGWARRSTLACGALVCALTALFAGQASAKTLTVGHCRHAQIGSIQAAVDRAHAGDTVSVCPGTYAEQVTVAKPLTVRATGDPVGGDCLTRSPADPSDQAIIDPGDGGFTVALRLAADRIRVSGFVIEGASVGIDSSDRFSGYRVDHNLIENNSLFGMDFGSVGGRESRVDHNCLLDNYYGLVSELDDDSLWKPSDGPERDPWNARDLSDARIDHNITVHDTTATDEGGGLAASGPGQHDRVSIDHNRLGDEVTGILLQHATRSAIVANDITSTHFAAILIGGASNALEIRANAIHGTTTAPGIFFEPRDFIDVFPTPSTDVLVSENDIHGMGAGIYARAASLTASLIEGNIASDNRGNGIETFSGGNVFRNNTADNNGVAGLTAFPGATGNRFEHNILHGNAFVGMGASFPAADARDLDAYVNGPFQNIWIDNDCDTDLPTGTICGA